MTQTETSYGAHHWPPALLSAWELRAMDEARDALAVNNGCGEPHASRPRSERNVPKRPAVLEAVAAVPMTGRQAANAGKLPAKRASAASSLELQDCHVEPRFWQADLVIQTAARSAVHLPHVALPISM